MKKSILSRSLLMAMSLLLPAGCVVYERQPPPAEVAPEGAEVANATPPPPLVETVQDCPGPVALWFWIPGHWAWRGRWVWVGGEWEPRPHPRAVWVEGHWARQYQGYVWVEGHWR